jgi:hypothetical protein
MATGRLRSLIAATAIVALVSVFHAPMARADTAASWGGRVFSPDRVTPRPGVIVSLTGDEDRQTVRSTPTRADGAFVISDASAGTYELTVETPEGVFVSSEPLELESGVNTPMALALSTGPVNAKLDHGLGSEQSRRTEFIFAGVISVFALLVILEITDDESETSASVN